MKLFMQKYYLPLVYIIGLISWVLDTAYLYLPFVIIVLGIIIYFNINRIYLIPLMIVLPFTMNNINNTPFIFAGYIIIILILSYDIYNQKLIEYNPIIKRMILLLIVMILSLLFTLSTSLSLVGILSYLIYFFTFYYFYNIKDNNKKNYIIKNIIYLSILIFSEIIIYLLSNIGINFKYSMESLDLGWGSYNLISLIYLIFIPISAYYYLDTKKAMSFIFILFNISMVFLMMTRGSYIALLLLSVPFFMQVYNDADNKSNLVKQFLLYVIFTLLFRLFVSTPTGMMELWYKRINNLAISFANNDLLFDLGVKIFKISPIFGTGVNTSSIYLSLYDAVEFPNYIIETLVTLGIVGLIVFMMYLITVLKVTTGSRYNRYVRYAFLCVVVQGLFETSFYNIAVMIVLSIILCCLEENKKGEVSANLLIK